MPTEQNASQPLDPTHHRSQGIETHPRSPHLPSLLLCFLISEASAAAPGDTPASDKLSELSGVTEKSNAAGLPCCGGQEHLPVLNGHDLELGYCLLQL